MLGRARTLGHGTSALGSLVALAARPLEGRTVAVRAGPAQGLQLRVERRSLVWLTGKLEPEVQLALRHWLRRGDAVIDVGAGVGFHSLLAARLVGASGTVVAFEPDPHAAAAARENAALNGFANVTVVEQALSRVEGTAFLDGAGEATARIVPAQKAALRVQATSLDAFLAERQDLLPSLVKIDVEGHETAVLEGMSTTLARARPVLVVEPHGDRSFLQVLERVGYSCAVLGHAGPVEDAPWWAHVLALPPGTTRRQ